MGIIQVGCAICDGIAELEMQNVDSSMQYAEEICRYTQLLEFLKAAAD